MTNSAAAAHISSDPDGLSAATSVAGDVNNEFRLPGEMRDLAQRLFETFVDPCDSGLRAAKAASFEARERSRARVDEERKTIERLRVEGEAQTLRLESDGMALADKTASDAARRAATRQLEIDAAFAASVATARRARAAVCDHARKSLEQLLVLGISDIPSPEWLLPDDFGPLGIASVDSSPTSQSLDMVDDAVAASGEACTRITDTKPQENPFRPNDDGQAMLLVVGALIVAAFSMKIIPEVAAFFIVAVVSYFLFLFLWANARNGSLRHAFSVIDEAGAAVAQAADDYVEQAKGVRSAGLKAVYSELAQARAECTKEREAAHFAALLHGDSTLAALATRRGAAEAVHSAEIEAADEGFATAINVLRNRIAPIARALQEEYSAFRAKAGFAGLAWHSADWSNWAPDSSPEFAAQMGELTFDVESVPSIAEMRAVFDELRDVPSVYSLPALMPFAEGKGLLITAAGDLSLAASEVAQSLLIRALANTPPGRARFTLIDPVALGHNVSDLMHLGDFDPALITGKAWTEPRHIEEQLAKVTEEMETVIQTFLRRKYSSLEEYNRDNPAVAEPFRFLGVFDFPVNLSDDALRRLLSILSNGPRCGVFTVIVRDTAKPSPDRFSMPALEHACTAVTMLAPKESVSARDGTEARFDTFRWDEPYLRRLRLTLDALPPADLTTKIIGRSGELAERGMRKELPFSQLMSALSAGASWGSASTSEELRVALGPSGRGSPQYLRLGGSQEAHALLVGRTGSGKTNLMHVIITGLALTYAPAELQLYLIDFKGGVGFKRYADRHLPHAAVIAIETEREFGISVLRRLDDELKRRAEVFRGVGVDNLASFRSVPDGSHRMPRILLVVDEFQEFFTENDSLSQEAKTIFERLARQGRSFGIHFMLATQSLAGSAQLPASIMGQIKVRIALACAEADARLVLADDNKAARLLSRPGEAIYNPMGGLIEGNNRFQVALFSEDDDLDTSLGMIHDRAIRAGVASRPIVFEGNTLAPLEYCAPLRDRLVTPPWSSIPKSIDIHLGEPIAIAPPVSASLRRQSGSNLMIVTRDEREGIGMCLAALLNIVSQTRPDGVKVVVADFATADSEWAGLATAIASWFPSTIRRVSRQREIGPLLHEVAEEVRQRADGASPHGSLFLVLQGMHRIRALREDDEDADGYNSVALLGSILRDGPEVGVHVVAWADTVANASRASRRLLSQFGLRAGSAMSSEDSVNFFDTAAASKFTKPHRALFSDEDKPGALTTFRPYAMPSMDWVDEIGRRLQETFVSLSAN